MSLKSKLIASTAFLALGASIAHAEITADQLAAAYAEYDYVEVKTGPTQIKVEATSGNRTLEVVYDRATGEIIQSEIETADADDRGRRGVEFDNEDSNFVDDDENDDDENDDDEDDDDERDDDDEDDDDEDDDERDDDDEDDDDENDDGEDDDENDDD